VIEDNLVESSRPLQAAKAMKLALDTYKNVLC